MTLLALSWLYPPPGLCLLSWGHFSCGAFLALTSFCSFCWEPLVSGPAVAYSESLKWAAFNHSDVKFSSVFVLPPLFLFWTSPPKSKIKGSPCKTYQIFSLSWQFLLADKKWLWRFELKSLGCSFKKKKNKNPLSVSTAYLWIPLGRVQKISFVKAWTVVLV